MTAFVLLIFINNSSQSIFFKKEKDCVHVHKQLQDKRGIATIGCIEVLK